MNHSRWSEAHRSICNDCRDAWEDEMQDTAHDIELDALIETV